MEKIASPRREPADVLLCQLKIKSLEQEHARLKEAPSAKSSSDGC